MRTPVWLVQLGLVLCFGTIALSCSSDSGARTLTSSDRDAPLLMLYDHGARAGAGGEHNLGGLAYILWANGEFVISGHYPRSTGDLRSGAIKAEAIEKVQKVLLETFRGCSQNALLIPDAHTMSLAWNSGDDYSVLAVPYLLLREDAEGVEPCALRLQELIAIIANEAKAEQILSPELARRVRKWASHTLWTDIR
jgi:hypothetical protein